MSFRLANHIGSDVLRRLLCPESKSGEHTAHHLLEILQFLLHCHLGRVFRLVHQSHYLFLQLSIAAVHLTEFLPPTLKFTCLSISMLHLKLHDFTLVLLRSLPHSGIVDEQLVILSLQYPYLLFLKICFLLDLSGFVIDQGSDALDGSSQLLDGLWPVLLIITGLLAMRSLP
jgi:hypothetical protein